MKKILIGLATLTLFVTTVAPALACESCYYCWRPSRKIEVRNQNWANVKNNVTTIANTGDNEIEGRRGSIRTGDAYADAIVQNTVNTNETKIRTPCRRGCVGGIEVENENGARVRNRVVTIAKTGDNKIETNNGCWEDCRNSRGEGCIVTGRAKSLSTVINVINSNITRIRR